MSAPDNFVLTDSTYDSFVVEIDGQNEFKVWQGLVGAHYTPYVDGVGNLSWTNNGGLPNPPTVNVTGKGLTITGIVATSGDLPATADQFATYLVGTVEPYSVYMYYNGAWVNIGEIGKGEQGEPGFSPVVTVSPITGGHQISITDAEDTETFDVMDGEGVPTGGTTGQVLAKASGTNYDTEWVNQSAGVDPATASPLVDGTAAVGTSTKYAREDHVHPTDTSRAEASKVVMLDGSNQGFFGVSTQDVNNFYCGSILCSPDVQNLPTAEWWFVISGGMVGTRTQVAYSLFNNHPPKTRYQATGSGGAFWSAWTDVVGGGGGALYFTSVAISATTGDIATVSNANITADHVVAEVTWANPAAITTDVTWTTASGSLVLNGTCTAATTANIVLVKKNN